MDTSKTIYYLQSPRIHNELSEPIVNPQLYYAHIRCYYISLGEMLIEVFEPQATFEPSFSLILNKVIYFEGPTKWNGAHFYLGSIDEIKELLAKQWLSAIDDLEMQRAFVHNHILLKLDNSTYTVRILAHSCFITAKKQNIHISFVDEGG